LGDYTLTVTRNGKTVTQNLKLKKSSTEFVIKIPQLLSRSQANGIDQCHCAQGSR
jgi:hypothetical protein